MTASSAWQVVEIDDLIRAGPQPREWIVERLIARSAITFLYGKPNVGKSWLCTALAGHVVRGTDLGPLATTPGMVLYLEGGENGAGEIAYRASLLGAGGFKLIEHFDRSPLGTDGREQLAAICEQHEVALVIADTMPSLWNGADTDETQLGNLMRGLRGLCTRTGTSLLLIGHTTKTNPKEYRGGQQILACCDTVAQLTPTRITLDKSRFGPTTPISLSSDTYLAAPSSP